MLQSLLKSLNTVFGLNVDALIHWVPLELKLTGFRGHFVPGRRGLLRKTFRCKQRWGISQLPKSAAELASEARWEKQVENFRFDPNVMGEAVRGGNASKMKMQTSTFGSSKALGPSFIVNWEWAPAPGAAAIQVGKPSVSWPGLTGRDKEPDVGLSYLWAEQWKSGTEDRKCWLRLCDRAEIQNRWARNSIHEHLLIGN